MSKDAFAGVYATMLEDDTFRDVVAEHPEVLNDWDLTDDEKSVLHEEASTEVEGFAFGSGPAMTYLSGGPSLSPAVSSRLGGALNTRAGLPTGALNGPGFLSNAACCPWGHAVVGNFGANVM
ncbi:MAG: hypothetical protein MUF83_15680 [Acidimicrobiales bacterium]|jgi:hypothetical protein|nr:hypothetical protein [Acidimicrobiales bacterium]